MSRDLTNTLRITEIFYSIQGESDSVGWPTVFVRLTGCPLRCQYCDTEYAFSNGEILSLEQIIGKVSLLINNQFKNKHILITGGEPLAQKPVLKLIKNLCDLGAIVSIETSGAYDIKDIDSRAIVVMDIKTPGSKEQSKNLWDNLNYLKPIDQVKFVICNGDDYNWSKEIINKYKIYDTCQVLFSPSYNEIKLKDLAEAILADNLPIRLQMQLHKYIWGDEQGR